MSPGTVIAGLGRISLVHQEGGMQETCLAAPGIDVCLPQDRAMRKPAQCPQQPSICLEGALWHGQDTFIIIVQPAEKIETICSDVVGYGLAS